MSAGALAFLTALHPAGLTELRVFWPHVEQRWYSDRQQAARVACELSARGSDVYAGALPRHREGGTKHDCEPGVAVWVDLEREDADERLRAAQRDRLLPEPTMLVASGGPGHRHCYWLLTERHEPLELEQANRRICAALEGDRQSVDAARILRVPGTRHQGRGQAVELLHYRGRRYRLEDLLAGQPELPDQEELLTASTVRHIYPPGSHVRVGNGGDPLDQLPPALYVEALTGRVSNRAGKIECPFHDDWNPSLHVYGTADKGWHCFQCGRGGTIVDLFGYLCGASFPLRGRDYVELRQQRAAELQRTAAA